MATQTQYLNAILDRLEQHIKQTAVLQHEVEEERKTSDYLREQIQRERKQREEHNQDFEVLRGELHRLRGVALASEQKASRLESELEDARLILEPLSLCGDLVEGLAYKDMAVDFVQKWGMKPADPYAGLVEYKQEVSANGK